MQYLRFEKQLLYEKLAVLKNLYPKERKNISFVSDASNFISLSDGKNDLIDIAYNISVNRWKKTNNLQLNIIDIKIHTKTVELQLHNKFYKCELTNKMKILITNKKGECISSDFSVNSNYFSKKQLAFAKKIISFAEIALGKAA